MIVTKITFFPAGPGSPTVPSPPMHLQNKQQHVLSATLTLRRVGIHYIWWHRFPKSHITQAQGCDLRSLFTTQVTVLWRGCRRHSLPSIFPSVICTIWGIQNQLKDILCSQKGISLATANSLHTDLLMRSPVPTPSQHWPLYC